MRFGTAVITCIALSVLFGCSTNPVTGKSEVSFVTEASEIEMGLTYYDPLQQTSGGIYRKDPQLTDYVQGVVSRLAKVSDRPELPYEIVIVDSDTVNAWALPGGKMAINRGLLQELKSEAELAAVLGHEMVHAAARHSARQMERGTLLMAGLAAADAALGNNKHRTLILAGASLGTYLLSLKYSRVDEREADHYGMLYMERAGYDPQQAVTLQKTFVRLFEKSESGLFSEMLASHPPSHDRVEANEALAKTLKQNLYVGKEAYENALEALLADIPAYEAVSQALTAIEENDLTRAEEYATQAITMSPKLYQGYRVLGLIAYERHETNQAITHFNHAISLHPDFYLLHYERGLSYEQAGQLTKAREDYVASLECLQTDDAAKGLKRINKLIRKEARKSNTKQYSPQ
jgi:predicted Zn-dependent protease